MRRLSIQKESTVSIQEQLVTQIALQIASGELPWNTALPSLRQLSRQCDIHINTCLRVYRELQDLGLIEGRPGSGYRVLALQIQQPHVERQPLETLLHGFLQQVRLNGYTLRQASELLSAWDTSHQDQPKIIFVDAHADIMPLFQAELSEGLGCPVTCHTLDTISASTFQSDDWVLVNRYHYPRLLGLLTPEQQTELNLLLIEVTSGQLEKNRLLQLKPGSLVTLVSVSNLLLQMGEAIITALRGEDLLISTVNTLELSVKEKAQLPNTLRHAQLVFADALCLKELENSVKGLLCPLCMLSQSELDRLKSLIPDIGFRQPYP